MSNSLSGSKCHKITEKYEISLSGNVEELTLPFMAVSGRDFECLSETRIQSDANSGADQIS